MPALAAPTVTIWIELVVMLAGSRDRDWSREPTQYRAIARDETEHYAPEFSALPALACPAKALEAIWLRRCQAAMSSIPAQLQDSSRGAALTARG